MAQKMYTEAEVQALLAAQKPTKTLSVEYRDPTKTYSYTDPKTGKTENKPGSGVFMLKGLRRMPQAFYANEWATLFSDKVKVLVTEAIKAHPDHPTK